MTVAAKQPPTAEQIQNAIDEGGLEFVDGEIVEKPMSYEERRVATRVAALLAVESMKTNAGDVVCEQGFRCVPQEPSRFRKPDIAFIRAGRLQQPRNTIDLLSTPGDLAVEVLSLNDTVYDVDRKVHEYLSFGFSAVWIVNPDEKSVIIRRADRSIAALYAEDDITGEDFLPAFKCKVAAFFE